MSPVGGITPSQEYEALRAELVEGKRYVFERPLLLAALGLAALDQAGAAQLPILAALMTLFLFNLWFTTNRLASGARIIAYIQMVLEEDVDKRGPGWETCLRYFRKWQRSHPDAKELVEAEVDHSAVPDALRFYPPIYWLHVGTLTTIVVGAVVLTLQHPSVVNMVCLGVVGILSSITAVWSVRHRPRRTRLSIERNRVIWGYALSFMNDERRAGSRGAV